MRNIHRQPPSDGFTIIEVLIVLGVAGLILLLVFQAIPTLLRNSRNNQRHQDIQIILSAVSHYELNNSGNFPSDCGPSQPSLCTQAGGGPNPNDYFLQPPVQAKLTYYQPNEISNNHQTTVPGGRTNQNPINNTEQVQIYNYEKCSVVTQGAATITGAGYSDVVALYAIEANNSGAVTSLCQEL